MKIILLVNDAPELTEQFIQLGQVFNYPETDIFIVKNIESELENNQFNKMIQNYTGTTIKSDLETAVNSVVDNVLILDDDYFFNSTGVTTYLETQLISYPDGVGLIIDGQIKVLYIHKDNFIIDDYSGVYEPEDISTYFANQKVLNANRTISV